MVLCKFYRQGNCHFGQYCQFEHINIFRNGNKVDFYNEDEYTLMQIAKETLNAERGGQWLLSCFAPLNGKPCIPGMEDLSPEEARWEIYEAQKNGMVEQAKIRFEQLCQDMKAKRQTLKNPTKEIQKKLKEILGIGHKRTTGEKTSSKSSSFSFANPQLGLPSNASTSNVFGNKTYGNQNNRFSGGFGSTNNTSVFGRTTTTSNPVFGSAPTFGSNLGVFGGDNTSTNTAFGATTNTSTFNTGQNAPQTFISSGSIFGGGSSQPVFGQSNIFGSSSQINNVFARPQTSQSTTSAFNSGATSSSSLFSGSSTQPSTSIFGGAKTSTANPFGGSSTMQTSNPIFGTASSSGNFNSGIFSPSKSVPAFGGAPVFGGGATFGSAPAPLFGEKPTFGASGGIFGASNTTAPAFSSAQPANAFGAAVSTSATNIFAQNTAPTMSTSTSPFGTTSSTAAAGPFATAAAGPFATAAAGPFATATSFSKPAFGTANETFGTAVTSSSAPFGIANTSVSFGTPTTTTTSPFTSSTFGDMKASPFASTNATTTTTAVNPFVPQQISSPFGGFAQSQTSNTATVSSSGLFGKPTYTTTLTATVINESIYSTDNQLTDDEKSMYLAEKFTFGKIPLKPPTKEVR